MISAGKVCEVPAPYTCNCLLAGSAILFCGQFDVVVGCYQLNDCAHNPTINTYRGSVYGLVCGQGSSDALVPYTHFPKLDIGPDPFPGIFDLIVADGGHSLLATCTDGSVRLLRFEEGLYKHSMFHVSDTMVTSCSPLYGSCGSGAAMCKWLCTAHLGSVVFYDACSETVVMKLEGHDYDAWCSASGSQDTALTGGDDGAMKWWDTRAGCKSVGKMRFDAGVVSISPVTECNTATTTYALVGSYDEKLYLVDSRCNKGPLSSIALGGGVWRCSRQMLEEELSSDARGAMHCNRWVQRRNALAVPVMQGGVALVRYDVTAPSGQNFAFLGHLHQSSAATGNVHLPPNALFYDCAVIPKDLCQVKTSKSTINLATCDFYNKVVSLWEVDGVKSSD
ncbi:hypothetical protein ERJ75_001407800 [Trypanosoma vivax]|uniref:Guanine nucleotide-binding protein subunit beta-like protein n=1 Tax=Trypanosoma vivax (strain Y486) TaxID=1055687 RepID=G0TRS5_TRYVY|nr:hypothetical protein TRVL_04531 [Trypanosoma vivax]KAH8607470.1 hypothetical protein ERJ75_001407800 [Trypanosoma vivax]CCC46647.1 conserved hypothetical protein [Trypanosoma vivax Y486]